METCLNNDWWPRACHKPICMRHRGVTREIIVLKGREGQTYKLRPVTVPQSSEEWG